MTREFQCVPDITNDPFLAMIEEIKLAHQERDKRGPFCFSFGPYDLDEESSDEEEEDK